MSIAMKMNKLLVAVATVLSLTANSSYAQDLPEISFATEPTFPPFEFTQDGKIVGFEIDLINAIGRAAGFTPKIVAMPFDAILPAVMGGVQEAAISGISKNPEREKKVLFSDGTVVAGQAIMIRKDSVGQIHKMEDLKGHKVCVQLGSVGADIVRGIEGAEAVTFNSMPEAYMELKKKGCDAAVTGNPVHQYYLASTKDQDLVYVKESLVRAVDLGIITRKGNEQLIEKINAGLKTIRENGEFAKIEQRWLPNE